MKNKKNKLVALGLVATGILAVILVQDDTMLVVSLVIGIPLFFSKDNWIR